MDQNCAQSGRNEKKNNNNLILFFSFSFLIYLLFFVFLIWHVNAFHPHYIKNVQMFLALLFDATRLNCALVLLMWRQQLSLLSVNAVKAVHFFKLLFCTNHRGTGWHLDFRRLLCLSVCVEKAACERTLRAKKQALCSFCLRTYNSDKPLGGVTLTGGKRSAEGDNGLKFQTPQKMSNTLQQFMCSKVEFRLSGCSWQRENECFCRLKIPLLCWKIKQTKKKWKQTVSIHFCCE